MTLPLSQTIGIRKYQKGVKDAHGNPSETWGAAVDTSVYSIAPTFSNEPFEAGREAIITGLSVLAPLGIDLGPRDRVVVNGAEWTVEGDLSDWTQGPFSWSPGLSFNLKRVDG